jgi:hypothetical protein
MISTTLSNILAAAGFDSLALPPTSKDDLALIAKWTLDLRRAIAAIESCDVEVFCYPTGTPFDPKVMGNAFQEKRTLSAIVMEMIRASKVFQTTEIGLKRLKRVETREMQRAEDVLLQPTVVLECDLQHLL